MDDVNCVSILIDGPIRVVFLDIDGVLNSHDSMKFFADQGVHPDDRMDPKAIKLLNELTDKTDAKIVVSSTWRLPFVDSGNLQGMADLLKRNGITGQVIGMTPDLWAVKRDRVRGDEIQWWMDNSGNQIDSFVILDDDSDMSHLRDKLVKTSMSNGLQRSHILDAMIVLNRRIPLEAGSTVTII
jgi:hypothetical protein